MILGLHNDMVIPLLVIPYNLEAQWHARKYKPIQQYTLYKATAQKWHCFMLLQIDDKIINGELQWPLYI